MAEVPEKATVCAGIMVGGFIVVLFGILPGSLLGGAVGIRIAGAFSGSPLGSELLPRMVVLTWMVMGLLITAAAVMFLSFVVVRSISALWGRLSGVGASRAAAGHVKAKE